MTNHETLDSEYQDPQEIISAINAVSDAWGDVLPGDSAENAQRITKEKFGENLESGPLGQIKNMIDQGILSAEDKNKISDALVSLSQTSPESPNVEEKIQELIDKLGS